MTPRSIRPESSRHSTIASRSAGSSRVGSSSSNHRSIGLARAGSARRPRRGRRGSWRPAAPRSVSAAHAGPSIACARSRVRSAAGRSKMSSRTLCTRVPRTASGEDGSGSRSTVRNRNISAQLRKSAARLGDSEPTILGTLDRAHGAERRAAAPTSGVARRLAECPSPRACSCAAAARHLPDRQPRRAPTSSCRRPGSSSPALIAVLVAPRIEQVQPDLGALKYVAGLAFAVILYLSVLLHEASHAYMARHYGYRVTSITLHFLGGMTAIDSEARKATPGVLDRGRRAGHLARRRRRCRRPLVRDARRAAPGGRGGAGRGQPARRRAQPGARAAPRRRPGAQGGGLGHHRRPAPRCDRRRLDRPVWSAGAGAALADGPGAAARRRARHRRLRPGLRHRPVPVDRGDRRDQRGQGAPAAPGPGRAQPGPTHPGRPGDLPLAEAVRRAQDAEAGGIVTVTSAGAPVGVVNEAAAAGHPGDRRPWVATSTVARDLA